MDFASQIKQFTEQVEESLTDIVREVVFDVGDSLITLTPVKTGRLKGNWNFDVSAPSSATNWENYDPDGSMAYFELEDIVGTLTYAEVVYMTNALNYAETAEDVYGYMMVRTTASRFNSIVEEVVARRRVK